MKIISMYRDGTELAVKLDCGNTNFLTIGGDHIRCLALCCYHNECNMECSDLWQEIVKDFLPALKRGIK